MQIPVPFMLLLIKADGCSLAAELCVDNYRKLSSETPIIFTID